LAKKGKKKSQSKPLDKKFKRQFDLYYKGNHYDLLEIYNALNLWYFDGKIKARICWGRRPSFPPRYHKEMIMGRCHIAERLIVIHRALDRSSIPPFVVENTVFHEMLHIKYPPIVKNGRRSLHHAKFMAAAKKFIDFKKAEQWEKNNSYTLQHF
jgi:hypothetical protein